MMGELEAEGYGPDKVAFVGLNGPTAEDFAKNMTADNTFAIFQDTPGDGVQDLHGGRREDVFIYGLSKTLVQYYRGRSDDPQLDDPEGYAAIKARIKAIVDASE